LELDPRRIILQFDINGVSYFLTFVEEERRWCLFAPTETGARRVPVYVDARVLGGRSPLEQSTNAPN